MKNQTISKSITQKQFLNGFLRRGFEDDIPFALWRKPKSDFLEVIRGNEGSLRKVELDLENLPSGFLVHPFKDQKDGKAYFIDAVNYMQIKLGTKVISDELDEFITIDIDHQKEQKSAFETFQKIKSEPLLNDNATSSESKDYYEKLVKLGIEGIKKGLFEKVVPARTKSIELDPSFDLASSFEIMLENYPNAFVNFFHLPGIGTWLGASPEILIETKEDLFYTMSLAGTQAASGDDPIKSTAWTQKEIEEQALVSRYIVDCFKKIRLREYEEYGPRTVQAGSLVHLRSDFRVDMKRINI